MVVEIAFGLDVTVAARSPVLASRRHSSALLIVHREGKSADASSKSPTLGPSRRRKKEGSSRMASRLSSYEKAREIYHVHVCGYQHHASLFNFQLLSFLAITRATLGIEESS